MAYRIALVGITGGGKSRLGNSLLGKDVFGCRASLESVTKECQLETAEGSKLTVVDTPGTMDSSDKQKAEESIAKVVTLCPDGLHSFLLVISYNRFTDESLQAIEAVARVFGESVYQYTVVVFTHAEGITDDANAFLKRVKNEGNANLNNILNKCSNRATYIENGIRCDKVQQKKQVQEIIKKVEEVQSANKNKLYTNWFFDMAKKIREQYEKSLRQREAKPLSQREAEVEAKVRELEVQNEQIRKLLEEMHKYFRAKRITSVAQFCTIQ